MKAQLAASVISGLARVKPAAGGDGLGDPDLTQLIQCDITYPVTRIDPDYSSWQALSPRTQPSGWKYTDPTSGLTCIKVTSATVPYSNTGMTSGQGYCDAGNPMSLPWELDGDWYVTIATFHGGDQRTWLVDLRLTGSGAPALESGTWRELTGSLAPQADVAFSFSNVTPQVAYSVNGTTVHRIITEDGSMALADTGNFPWVIGMSVGASPWLMHDKNDDWFVSTSESSGQVRVWQSSTDTKRTSPYTANEGRMLRDGHVLHSNISGDNFRVWNLAANTHSSLINGITQHGGSLQSRMAGSNWDSYENGCWDASWKATPTSWLFDIFDEDGTNVYDGGEAHHSGHWIQDVSGGYDGQYVLGGATHSSTVPNWCKVGMVLFNLDGTDARYVGPSYCGPYGATGYWYYGLPWPNANPTGHVITFTCAMAYSNSVRHSRYDLFAVIMPRST